MTGDQHPTNDSAADIICWARKGDPCVDGASVIEDAVWRDAGAMWGSHPVRLSRVSTFLAMRGEDFQGAHTLTAPISRLYSPDSWRRAHSWSAQAGGVAWRAAVSPRCGFCRSRRSSLHVIYRGGTTGVLGRRRRAAVLNRATAIGRKFFSLTFKHPRTCCLFSLCLDDSGLRRVEGCGLRAGDRSRFFRGSHPLLMANVAYSADTLGCQSCDTSPALCGQSPRPFARRLTVRQLSQPPATCLAWFELQRRFADFYVRIARWHLVRLRIFDADTSPDTMCCEDGRRGSQGRRSKPRQRACGRDRGKSLLGKAHTVDAEGKCRGAGNVDDRETARAFQRHMRGGQ